MNRIYTTISAPCETEYQEKKSRFFAQLGPASNKQDVMTQLTKAKLQYPDARHHCWAYLLGDPKQALTAGFNDDGEPSGTAGKPILNVLTQRAVGDVVVVVSRYFGGIKLGAGGLTRAYGQAVSNALDSAHLTQVIPVKQIDFEIAYSLEDACRHILGKNHAQGIVASYHEKVSLSCHVANDNCEKLIGQLRERCAGDIHFDLME